MLSDDVRRRLRTLGTGDQRTGAEGQDTAPEGDALAGVRKRVLQGARKSTTTGSAPAGATQASVVVRRAPSVETGGPLQGEELATHVGNCLALRLPVGEVAPWGDEFWGMLERFAEPRRAALHAARPRELVFLDIETTGLSGQPLFLIGMLRSDDAGPHILQFLARDYTEEAAVIAATAGVLRDAGVLVTYNGRTFDMPYIDERARYHRLRIDLPKPPHVDLLIHARSRARGKWRGRFANCKLQTLERGALGIVRTGDIPGAQIPQAYHEFVRSGRADQMHEILHHNRLDLLTLTALTGELLD